MGSLATITSAVSVISTALVRQIALKVKMIHRTETRVTSRILALSQSLPLSPLLNLLLSPNQILLQNLRQSRLLILTCGGPGPAYKKFVTLLIIPAQATPELSTKSIASSTSSRRSSSSSTPLPWTITCSETHSKAFKLTSERAPNKFICLILVHYEKKQQVEKK